MYNKVGVYTAGGGEDLTGGAELQAAHLLGRVHVELGLPVVPVGQAGVGALQVELDGQVPQTALREQPLTPQHCGDENRKGKARSRGGNSASIDPLLIEEEPASERRRGGR